MLNKLIGDNKTMMSSLIANLLIIRFTLIPIKFIVINNILVELPIFFLEIITIKIDAAIT